MAKIHALLPAAGRGLRFGNGKSKQYIDLCGRPLMWHSVTAFLDCRRIAGVHVVLAPDDAEDCESWPGFAGNRRLRFHRVGGRTRFESVRNGLRAMDAGGEDWVAVHDAARPCVSRGLIGRMLKDLESEDFGRIPALPLHDALKRVEDGRAVGTAGRTGKWLAQTPQLFRYGELIALPDLRTGEIPDESRALERVGKYPTVVRGDPGNIKVTVAEDLPLARAILAARGAA